jgi:hypothetical protein
MVYEIGADCVMPIQGKGYFQFRADTIDARDQDRSAHPMELYSKESAETADFSEHLRSVRLGNELLNPALKPVTKIDIYARACVGLLFFRRSHCPNL